MTYTPADVAALVAAARNELAQQYGQTQPIPQPQRANALWHALQPFTPRDMDAEAEQVNTRG